MWLSTVVHVSVPEHEKTLIVLLFLRHESSTTVIEACFHLQVCVTSLLNTVQFFCTWEVCYFLSISSEWIRVGIHVQGPWEATFQSLIVDEGAGSEKKKAERERELLISSKCNTSCPSHNTTQWTCLVNELQMIFITTFTQKLETNILQVKPVS